VIDPRRRIPRTDAVLAELAPQQRKLGAAAVKAAVVAAQEKARNGEITPEQVVEEAATTLSRGASSLRPVINATGVVVHTNLGRAPLSDVATEAVAAAAGTTDVEFDLRTGTRARRGAGAMAALADAVPDAGGVHVVNNNAAALVLTALTLGGEIVISRGELVEIGDGFRIPELLAATGARLVEVGTTNRTKVADYANAISEHTGFVLKVHPSNFQVTGFAGTPTVSELSGLGVPLVVDIGSGLLAPHPLLPDEPDAATALADGADLVTASGDKLLGGPQAGLLLGDADLVHRLRRHPVARALRVDKLTLAALEATLRGPRTPVAEALETDVDGLSARAAALVETLTTQGIDALSVACASAVGGGGAPGVELPSAAVSLPESYAEPLRLAAVVGRVEHGRCLLDLRTVPPEQDSRLADAVLACT
jgi:L-seryl-tRNA(Ser) seleniumtransferase